MSGDRASDTEPEEVFVRLLDEGTDVWRPVPAVRDPSGGFRLLRADQYDPATETWEYPPGSVVECEVRGEGQEQATFAIRLVSTPE